ncbi:MAG: hypothetical protein A2977_02860 [Alphaproteobacteria bacterium RIFCSPLOWO2_01_FULL_45_8]|nr:MAG: hypothetical protein A2065_02100 [Alphaproteobacteria bacterium GWB1_45_5]OFW76393.1 MAG: hypothetical protein A3K20_02655 [Alphaproteobacteria bacterium GWA1_45_9]OFW89332.1 MAG: hypothetical protein A2621_00135 [Alphaproteobacteria bacterium RIFCSPHIGHO2_01_FULL_41_14]OFW96145.1 MAG: hypothetical protein A2977_02860 [Alphaproteobacteria bacterium RIFCSPLOWO2_01_FULL_45_8]HCI48310.1 DUF4440 domain-containing protein [Holosporales bacterium]
MNEIKDLPAVWLDHLARKDLSGILSLYAEEAALMPTLRNKLHKTPVERKEYFEFFLSFPDLHGVVINQYSRSYGDVAINTGVYKFIFLRQEEEIEIFARFSFTYKKEKGRWLIIDHHSSAFPEGV